MNSSLRPAAARMRRWAVSSGKAADGTLKAIPQALKRLQQPHLGSQTSSNERRTKRFICFLARLSLANPRRNQYVSRSPRVQGTLGGRVFRKVLSNSAFGAAATTKGLLKPSSYSARATQQSMPHSPLGSDNIGHRYIRAPKRLEETRLPSGAS